MTNPTLVYKFLLAKLRGEHFTDLQPMENEAELLAMANGYLKLNADNFDPADRFTNEFKTRTKAYLFEKGFFEEIKTRWNVSDEQIIDRGLVELPTFIENRLISRNLQRIFGDWIFELPVFTADELTFDRRKFKHGFMRPINNNLGIIGFEVFRNIKDRQPIRLLGTQECKISKIGV